MLTASESQLELSRLGRRLDANVAPIADIELPPQLGDLLTHGLAVLLPQVRARAVEALVALDLVGPVLREVLEEVLARSRAQVEQIDPDACHAGVARRPHDVREELGPVGEAREDRRQ